MIIYIYIYFRGVAYNISQSRVCVCVWKHKTWPPGAPHRVENKIWAPGVAPRGAAGMGGVYALQKKKGAIVIEVAQRINPKKIQGSDARNLGWPVFENTGLGHPGWHPIMKT